MSKKSSDEIIFCLSDIWKLLLRHRKKIFLIVFYISTMSFLIFLSLPTKYRAEATFKELEDRQENTSIKDLFTASTEKGHNTLQASGIMLSSAVLTPMIQSKGLQAKVVEGRGYITSFFINSYENILSEFKKKISDIDTFEFKDILYEGEISLTLYFRFTSSESYEILDSNKKNVGQGRVNSPFFYDKKVAFTFLKTPKNLKLKKLYKLDISPNTKVLSFLSENIKIKQFDKSNDILCLSLDHRDRHLAARILNSLMERYQEYLKTENHIFTKLQLSYLEERQDEVYRTLKKDFDEYVLYLSDNLGAKGFMTLDHELNSLLAPHNKYLASIFSIDLELDRLKNVDKRARFIDNSSSIAGTEISKIAYKLTELELERDSINLSLNSDVEGKHLATYQSKVKTIEEKIKGIDLKISDLKNEDIVLDDCMSGDYGEEIKKLAAVKQDFLLEKDDLSSSYNGVEDYSWIAKRNEDLEIIRNEKKQNEEMLNYLSNNDIEEISAPLSLKNIMNGSSNDFSSFINNEDRKNDVKDYIKHHIHLLSLKENMLKESHLPYEENEYNCLDIETAKKIYMTCNATLDEIKVQIEELQHGREELIKDEMEISSLSLILNDSTSLEVIKKAGSISVEINDVQNRGEKNIKRLQGELALQKEFLIHHMNELIKLKKIHEKVVLRKIDVLKKVLFVGVNQKITLLNETADNFVKSRIDYLNVEKNLLHEKTKELQEKMEILPQRWKLEKMLELKSDMSIKIMQASSQLLEAKTMAHHLHQIQSRPLDLAVAPFLPVPPYLLFLLLLSVVLATIFVFIFYFIKSALYGFHVSLASLEASNHNVGGVISPLCDGEDTDYVNKDIETLREVAAQISEKNGIKIVSLIGNGGPNYSFSLASLFGKSEKKVLIIECESKSYRSKDEDGKGFIAYLEKKIKKIPIAERKDYDLMQAGGYSRYFTEIVGSNGFINLINEMTSKYDYVFVYTSASLNHSSAKVLLNFSNMVVVTINDETMQEMKPYIDWRSDIDNRYLSFIAKS